MVVRVKWDHAGLRKRVEKWMKRQIPFVLSRALNATVLETRDELREGLPQTFTIRSKHPSRGIRVGFATKRNPTAEVGTVDEYMARQVFGGEKRGEKRGVAVPIGARPRPKSKTTKSKWPGELKRRKKGFYKPGRGGAQLLMIPRRGNRLRLMYVLLPRIEVPERWDLEGVLEAVAKREWRDNVREAWNRALRTARR